MYLVIRCQWSGNGLNYPINFADIDEWPQADSVAHSVFNSMAFLHISGEGPTCGELNCSQGTSLTMGCV